MKHSLPITKECTVYPGEYNLCPETKKRFEQVVQEATIYDPVLPVNLDKFQDSYRIEVAIPGGLRENILIDINDNLFSIVLLKRESVAECSGKAAIELHEFDETVTRQIVLPDDINAELVSATFLNGILRVDIPKDNQKPVCTSNRVVIY